MTCIVCMEIFKTPVSLSCGHSFCKVCIGLHLKERPFCPVCKFPTFNVDLPENITIKNIIDNYKEKHPEEFEDEEEVLEKKPEINQEHKQNLNKKEIYKPSIILRSRKIGNTLYPGTMYRIEIDYKESEEFFRFLVQNQQFVLIHTNLKRNLNKINEEMSTRFEFVKVEKFKPETVIIMAMAKEFVEIEKIGVSKYGENQNSENEEDNEKNERKKLLIDRLKTNKAFENIKGEIEFCYYKKTDFKLTGDFSVDSEFGKSLLFLYQKVNFFLQKFKKSNPQMFYTKIMMHRLRYGVDNILTTQVRLNMIKAKKIPKNSALLRNIEIRGIKMDIFNEPHKFGYLLCMLLKFDKTVFKTFGMYKSMNLIFKKSFELMKRTNDNSDPLFLFRTFDFDGMEKIKGFVKNNFWAILAVLIIFLSFYLSGTWD